MQSKQKKGEFRKTLIKAWNYKWVYVMLLPVMAYFAVFKYVPMYGITIAFKNYNIFQGVFKSEWVGFSVFQKIFANKNFWSAIKNTFILNLSALAVSFPLTIIVSLMLNEIRGMKFKKVTQSVLYLPHFISWVVVAGIATNLFALQEGTVNAVLQRLGIGPVPFLSSNGWWILLILSVIEVGVSVVMTQSLKMATVVVSTVPILVVYPWLQKYFVKGVMLGSVKG